MATSSIVTILFGGGFILLVIVALIKAFSKNKRKSDSMYTPYDDMTRGTNNMNDHKHLAEDTRHTIPVEEQTEID
ncbi:hypothetical protein MKY34_07255 [Sporosarcina sp. FSL K6-1522]|uniref:hypothetical protein n=1 Tax=Sporosarcina sp. FSL K6-1522 TaxID=2921554 RepID=UPI00315A5C52